MFDKGQIVRIRCPKWKHDGKLAVIRDIPITEYDSSYMIAFTDDPLDWDTYEINEFYLMSVTVEDRFLFHIIGSEKIARGEFDVRQ